MILRTTGWFAYCFGWQWIFGHSHASAAKVPLLQLDLHLQQEDGERTQCVELRENELNALIAALESATEVSTSVWASGCCCEDCTVGVALDVAVDSGGG